MGGGDDRDQLHRRQHWARLALVALGLALELASGLGRRPDPERPELRVLRRAVEGDDPEVGEDPAPAARQLRRRLRGRRGLCPLGLGTTAGRLLGGVRPGELSEHEHDHATAAASTASAASAAAPIDRGRVCHPGPYPIAR